MKTQTSPTKEVYGELQRAYDHFNRQLFAGKLPKCLITLQRKPRTGGYFSPKRFQHTQQDNAVTDEIAMNPDHFQTGVLSDVLSILVHEMVHLQQAYFGSPGRKGYHNKEWAKMMGAAGLTPSDTGKPGGKTVGQHMSHFVEPGGRFERACEKLLSKGFYLSWTDKLGENKSKPKSGRVKYTCDLCGLNAWAKPNSNLICGDCRQTLATI